MSKYRIVIFIKHKYSTFIYIRWYTHLHNYIIVSVYICNSINTNIDFVIIMVIKSIDLKLINLYY